MSQGSCDDTHKLGEVRLVGDTHFSIRFGARDHSKLKVAANRQHTHTHAHARTHARTHTSS